MKNLSLSRRAVFALAFATLAPALPLTAAQNGEEFRVSIGAGHRYDADIDHHRGDFNETRAGISVSDEIKINDRWKLDPFLSYRFSSYDFSKSEPWDDLHVARVTVLAQYALNEKWAVFAGPTVSFAADDDADFGEAFTFGGVAGVIYRVNERLAIGAGLGVTAELEDNPRVRPAIIVKWRINDHWSAESGYFEVAGSGGPGAEIRYHLNEHWSFGLGAQYQETRFRMEDYRNPLITGDNRSERVGEDTSLPVYLKALWQVNQKFGVEAVGGVTLGGELRIDGKDGHKVTDEDYDPAPFAGLRAVLTF
jgi:long-subunit fatty acid transport protein